MVRRVERLITICGGQTNNYYYQEGKHLNVFKK